ncbi:MAG: protein phosphatase 2C domain-containing protein [Gemmatimonadaceae bacterium]|nr:protein phosphatase 2C domain-containing protein [Gemmatimonadaceae bacterium]
MADERDEAAVPLAAEPVAAPASWSAREPAMPWHPATLDDALTADFVVRASSEPGVCALRAGAWNVLGASVRGKSHAHRGEYRDDAMASLAAEGLVLLAVADGAGSSALSRIGAAVTAQFAVERTAARFAASDPALPPSARLGTAMAHAVHDAAMRLHELAALAALSPAALRTTLLLVAIAGDLMLVSQVGDGAVLVQRSDGSVVRVGAMRETAWAGEVTCFVPDACAMTQAAELRQVNAADVSMIALMSDGIDDPFHPLEQSGDALIAQWRNGTTTPIGTARQAQTGPVLGSPDALLEWLAFEQRGEVDDRTLLLAWRDDGAGR